MSSSPAVRRRTSRSSAAFAVVLTMVAAGCAAPAPEPVPGSGAVGGSAPERIARWTRERPGQPLPASIAFRGVQPDSAILRLLQRYGVRPYVAHAWAGTVGMHAQVPAERADPAVLGEARRLLLDRLERNACNIAGRVARFRQDQGAADRPAREREAEREFLGRLRAERQALARVRGGGPVIWSVYVTGAPDAVARLGADPMVWAFEPVASHVEEGQVIVGVPRPPEPPPVGEIPDFSDIARMPIAQVRAQLDAMAAEPAPPCRAGGAADRLPPGHWVVVARHGGRAVLAPRTATRGAERGAPQAEPTSLEVLIHTHGEPARTDTAELVPLQLPGVSAAQARPLRIGRVRLDGRAVYFTPPGWAPLLLPSPADPDLYLFAEANALWTLTPGGDVRRVTAERTGDFDRAALATRQREGIVILYWAADPVWSPDGRTIAYVTNREAVARDEAGQAVWLLDLASGGERPLLSEPDESFRPLGWLGRELLYTGPPGVGAVDAARATRRQLAFGLALSVATDGSAVAVADNVPHATRIQVLSVAGSVTIPAAPAGSSYAAQALFSPGSRRLLLLATTPDGRGRRYFVFQRDSALLTPVHAPDDRFADWPSWLDDDTLLVPTLDATTRTVSSWIVDVGAAPGA